ncbi:MULTISPECIES: MerR family transcriptional regulator [unclassified Microbacterium]|uniref:MerR family transcriptional regulator n=1 Tax=unclassified Microbacterium TaxID=2609290 RepID=UPI000EA86F22|nr:MULTISPECIES: MerR family transcriptional regulator [unclassified Microbacterium]MBT2486432.1 MerR family transcriptional regulator [Microbacterium sp. ISL-108]RKN69132.1 MerR family transcriptional regulator [Microbacterium sp. CGR2]
MLIGEIAAIAQVSPRAIRHYHREGVLPEPARAPNGYRLYSVTDLTRLLRIRRLVALGLPLHRIGEMLIEERDDVVVDELAALESSLLEQIDRMQAQLAAVRAARSSSSPEVIALYDSDQDALRELWSLPDVRRIERDMTLLLMSAGTERLRESLRAGLSDSAGMVQFGDLSRQLRAMDETSSQAERDAAIAALSGVLAQWTDLPVQPRLAALVNDYLEQAFTPPQLDIISRATAKAEQGTAGQI